MEKNKIKINNSKNKLFSGLKPFLKRLEENLIREIKEEDFDKIWLVFKRALQRNDFAGEEIKIFSAGIFIAGSIIWIGNGGFISTAHSDELEAINAQPSDSKIVNVQPKEILKVGDIETVKSSLDAKAINDYKLKSQGEQCQEDKSQKKTSQLCGKDDEEEVKKIARQEELAKIAAFRPRVVRLSCGEKNYGDPSKSQTKGKHMDEDCCPDPDEWPKPGCSYDAHGYGIMLSGPAKKK